MIFGGEILYRCDKSSVVRRFVCDKNAIQFSSVLELFVAFVVNARKG